MCKYILTTLILIIVSVNLISQIIPNKIFYEMENEEFNLKIINDYNTMKTLNIIMSIKKQILIPIIYKKKFIVEEGLFKYNKIYVYFPYDLEQAAIDMEMEYQQLSIGDTISEIIHLKDLSNPIEFSFTYSYVSDTNQFDDVIMKKMLSYYYVRKKWGTIKFNSDM